MAGVGVRMMLGQRPVDCWDYKLGLISGVSEDPFPVSAPYISAEYLQLQEQILVVIPQTSGASIPTAQTHFEPW